MTEPKTIRIDGVIGTGEGEISAQMVRDQLPKNSTDPIAVKIHSEGGSVFEGFAIHDLLAAYQGPKSAAIESSAFSIASYIAMAFDDVEISPNGYMMLHNPYNAAEGDDEEFAKQSQLLAQLKTSMVQTYSKRTGKSEDEIKAILKNETYLNAQQSVDMGFANRITGSPVIGRAFAKLKHMPHGVVSALFGADSDGENRDAKKEPPMSSQPVAATLQEIKAAFPTAKAEFVIKCLERSLPLASVAAAAAEELMAENDELKAKVAALEEENAKAKAKAMEDDEEEEAKAKAKAESDEEEEPDAKAKARNGVKPIAKAKTSGPSAIGRWEAAIDAALPKCGGNKMKAVALANRNNPGLREAMLSEINAR